MTATFPAKPPPGTNLRLKFKTGGVADVVSPVTTDPFTVDVRIPGPRLWTLDDPFLYEVEATLAAPGNEDRVATYFGMRNIAVEKLPGTEYPYIALNGKPIYLQMTLDQSYHPEGFYTFPSDALMRDEILRSKRIGLHANRLAAERDGAPRGVGRGGSGTGTGNPPGGGRRPAARTGHLRRALRSLPARPDTGVQLEAIAALPRAKSTILPVSRGAARERRKS